MAETIDDKISANLPPQQKKEEKKPLSTLESVIGELGDLFNLGIGISAPAAAYAFTGNAGVPVVSAAFVAGSGGTLTSKKIRNESIVGTLWGTMLHYFSLPLQYMSTLGKAAYVALLPFASNSVVPTADHLINYKSPKGLYEKLRKIYWPNVKKTFKTIWPLNLVSALYFTQPAFIVGAIGVANYLFRKFVVKSQQDEAKDVDKTPYLVAAANVTTKLAKNTVGGFYTGLYDVGKSIGNAFGSSYQPSAPAQPAPARPAPSPAPSPAPAH